MSGRLRQWTGLPSRPQTAIAYSAIGRTFDWKYAGDVAGARASKVGSAVGQIQKAVGQTVGGAVERAKAAFDEAAEEWKRAENSTQDEYTLADG